VDLIFAIVGKDTDQHIGDILINCIKQLVFNIAQFHTIKLEVFSENKHAIKFYKKNGFFTEGRLKEFIYCDNKWHDVMIMGIVNDQDR
jgi:RimJ/RimL family protein N-acetyltransferase